jgi:GNAT superfamily N-acetyltransferase
VIFSAAGLRQRIGEADLIGLGARAPRKRQRSRRVGKYWTQTLQSPSRARGASLLQEGSTSVAQADIIIADDKLLPRAVELYNGIFRPKREADFFKRRFMGRYNALTLIARMDDKPVGFWIGFELKPGMFYHWLGAVVPDVRRQGVGRQLQEAQQAWAKDHGYEYIRCECMNHQREFIHFAVTLGYDIVGIRWDSTHADNLVVFEKNLID